MWLREEKCYHISCTACNNVCVASSSAANWCSSTRFAANKSFAHSLPSKSHQNFLFLKMLQNYLLSKCFKIHSSPEDLNIMFHTFVDQAFNFLKNIWSRCLKINCQNKSASWTIILWKFIRYVVSWCRMPCDVFQYSPPEMSALELFLLHIISNEDGFEHIFVLIRLRQSD